MQETNYYQLLREDFIEQGTRETTIKNTLTLLNDKFAADAVNDLIPVLKRINVLQQLEQLHIPTARVQSQ